jgi:hypothetical protein
MNHIFYHDHGSRPCFDGTVALFYAFVGLDRKAETHKAVYGKPLPVEVETLKDATVYFVDFTYQNDQFDIMVQIASVAKKLVLIDHHFPEGLNAANKLIEMSKEEKKKGFPFADIVSVFNNAKSGAVLTFEYFNSGANLPALAKYASDYDLWTKTLPYCDEVAAFFYDTNPDFAQLSSIEATLEDLINGCLTPFTEALVIHGRKCLAFREKQMNEYVSLSFPLQFTVPAVDKNGETKDIVRKGLGVFAPLEYASALGAKLAVKGGPGSFGVVMMPTVGSGEVKIACSFRNDKADVEKQPVNIICKMFNGGGHNDASGCQMTIQDLNNALIKE